MARYYNTTDVQVSTIKTLIKESNEYDSFRIKFEAPVGDVLYLKRVDGQHYERYMPIGNLFALNVTRL